MKKSSAIKSQSIVKTLFTMIDQRNKKAIMSMKDEIKKKFWCLLIPTFLYKFDINDPFADEMFLKIFPMSQEKLNLLKQESKK